MPSWKEQKQALQQQKRCEREARRQLLVEQMTPEELHEYDEKHREFKQQKMLESRQMLALQRSRLENAPILAIDLAYYDLMKPAELKSLHQQIMFCYSTSLKSPKPLKMALFNYQEDKLMMQRVSGFCDWKIALFETPLENQPRLFEFVYLSGDAAEVLEEYDPNATYVIGGLVDRNRHKGIALERAKQLGIKSRRIDIRRFAALRSSQILAVNHIFELMTKMFAGETMGAAVGEIVPGRKLEQSLPQEASVAQ